MLATLLQLNITMCKSWLYHTGTVMLQFDHKKSTAMLCIPLRIQCRALYIIHRCLWTKQSCSSFRYSIEGFEFNETSLSSEPGAHKSSSSWLLAAIVYTFLSCKARTVPTGTDDYLLKQDTASQFVRVYEKKWVEDLFSHSQNVSIVYDSGNRTLLRKSRSPARHAYKFTNQLRRKKSCNSWQFNFVILAAILSMLIMTKVQLCSVKTTFWLVCLDCSLCLIYSHFFSCNISNSCFQLVCHAVVYLRYCRWGGAWGSILWTLP